MCNQKHPDHDSIPVDGTGYKFFFPRGRIALSLVDNTPYQTKDKRRVTFHYSEVDDGFCFMIEKPDHTTEETIKNSFSCAGVKPVLLKIRYKRGVCKQIEKRFLSNREIEIALAEEIELVGNKYYFKEPEEIKENDTDNR